MMTKAAITPFTAFLVACASLAMAAGTALAASLTITPPSVASDYTGTITLNITGLATSQTVLVETFLDTNSNGVIDSGEMLVQSFQVTDGQALSIGGVRNTNVPGDEDATAGTIRTVLNFPALAEANKGVAKFVYRVSPVTSGFTPVTAAFTIIQPPQYNQKVVGKVTSGGSAVPYAFTFLTDPSMNGGPMVAALADASGNFTLYTAPGSYAVVALKAGFVSDFSALPVVTVNANATVTQNLSLTTADRTISGQLKDLGSGAGIPGVQTTARSESGLFALVFSDASGNFVIPVSSASTQWGVSPSEKPMALLGYMSLDNSYGVDISGGNVSGVSIQLPKATALIYGTLKDGTNLAGVDIYAYHDQYDGYGLTDSSGRYVVGVLGTTEGSWGVEADSAELALLGYLAPHANVPVNAGQAVEQDLVAQTVTAHLIGRATDDGGNPLDNACINAWSDQGANADGSTDSNGNFSLGVVGGTWHLQLCSDDAQQRGLVRPTLTRSVQNGVDVTGIQYVALHSTYQITGVVHDGGGNPISSVNVYGNATINDINYNAQTNTGGNGTYVLPVVNGSWYVSLECNDLSARGLPCPTGQQVTVSGQSQTLDFCVGCGPHLRGTVFDDSGNRIASIHITASPQYGGTSHEALTDGSGNFDIALSSNTGTWTLQLNLAEAAQRSLVSPSLPETVNNNDINGILFVAKHSTSLITGTVSDTDGNPVVGVAVSATADVSPVSYSASTTTGSDGSYQSPVINASWWVVTVSCNDLSARGFNCPYQQYAQVSNNNPVVNFTVQAVLRVTTSSLPPATQGVAYMTQLQVSGGQSPYTWSLGTDTPFLPPGLNLDASSGSISGTPAVSGTFNVHVWVSDYRAQTADAHLVLTVNPPLTTPTVTGTPTPTKTPGPCIGDCNTDHTVTIDDILTLVSIALGNLDVSHCLAGDANDDNQITVDEILRAVNAALNGCVVSPAEQGCLNSGGAVGSAMCCTGVSDFPNTCVTGACGCGPSSHEVRICECGADSCFDGSGCVRS